MELFDLKENFSSKLNVVKLCMDAIIPTRGSSGAAGLDLYINSTIVIQPGEIIKAPTGIAMSIPIGYYGRVAPRSGLSLSGIDVLAGVVDTDYRGEIVVILINLGKHEARFQKGSRIAQLIITKCLLMDPIEVSKLSDTQRNIGGFGSTGIN